MIIDVIVLIVFSFSVGLTSCSKNQFGNKSDVLADTFTNKSATRLQYFGYWGLGMNGLDGNISSASDYSNLVFISEDAFRALERRIEQAENLN